MKRASRRIVLLDTHAILHRAFHAMPGFTSSKGEPTGAIYGLALMLFSIIKEFDPDQIIAAFDLSGPTFRDDMYKDYKAGRAKLEDDLVYQLSRAKDLLAAFDIPILEKEGFEADDILGTLVNRIKDKNLEIIVASGDMDTMSLLSDRRVKVYTLKTGIKDTVLYDAKKAEERYGFSPELIPDYKALRGDPSDNIIGVPGIGEKTATELIQKFGKVEKMYELLKKSRQKFLDSGIKERIVKLLEDHEDEAKFSLVLATIRTDAPIELPPDGWKERFSSEKVREILEEFGFKSLISRIPSRSEMIPSVVDGPIIDAETTYKIKLAQWVLDSNESAPSGIPPTGGLAQLESEIKKRGLLRVYQDIELPLVPILREAEERGIMVDKKQLAGLKSTYQRKLEKLKEEIYIAAGVEFNINSPKQIGEIFFGKLGIGGGKLKKTTTGQISTNAKELYKLRGAHPAIDALLAHRELAKLLSTYIDAIPVLLDDQSRLHTHFIQWGSATGRLSSRDPNLQNIPIKTEQGKAIREIFVASPGYKLASFDYSQIDLRSLALLSGDEKLIKFFQEGGDIHADVAAELFGIAKGDVDKEQRRRAKVINFGIIYGMGVLALKQNLGGSRAEAEEFYDRYFKTFPGVAKYLEHVKAEARRTGYTETLFGRRRYFPSINSGPEYMQKAALRQAANAPIQGTTADIIKLAMIRASELIKKNNWTKDIYLLLQIHDELIYEIRTDLVETVTPLIKNIMESVVADKVPFPVKYSTGQSWGEL